MGELKAEHALSVMSDFSIGHSLLSPTEIPALAKERGYKSVALVDLMSISSMIPFTKACLKNDIKPIIGCKIRIVDDPLDKTPKKQRTKPNEEFFVKVYAKNEEGIRSLYRLLSIANQADHFYHHSRIGFEELLSELSRGHLLASTGDFLSVCHKEDYCGYIQRMASACGSSQTFVELCPIDSVLFDTLNIRAISCSRELSLPVLLTYPAMYLTEEDADTLDVMSAIAMNAKITDAWRPVQQIRSFTFCEHGELVNKAEAASERLNKRMAQLDSWSGAVWVEAIQNQEFFVNQINYVWKPSDVSLPKMADDERETLVSEVKKGWTKRLGQQQLGFKPDPADLPKYKERLQTELKVLRQMGFERYFLLVQDLVQWSKRNDITVGPGRGSVGGSLIAFLLGITDVDPLRFGLIFERFINPDRLDLPDADLDFMSSRRQEVVQYLVDRYGRDCVAGISNFTSLGAAGSIRDVSRVFNLERDAYSASKLVPALHGKSYEMEQAAEVVPEIDAFKTNHPVVWEHAKKLQGKMRSLGRHAAGIVVAGEPIVNRAVVETRGDDVTVNWDKRVVEEQGLVKMDILGLSTLDILNIAKHMIKRDHGVLVDYQKLPLDDEKVLNAFAMGDTIGVFQFESPGMRKLLRDISVRGLTFEDIAAATALYRPGPMDSGLMEDFVATKQGVMPIHYEHPNMVEALKETYGVIVYQEQVMKIAQDLAGFSMSDADHLRKAMGKKDPEMMAKQESKWVEGCKLHSDMLERRAQMLFDKIQKFAGYAFNKSHSVEYSIISYWAMWVKQYYPAQFYAASLSILDEDKLQGLVQDAANKDIMVVPPDINRSSDVFEVVFDTKADKYKLIIPFNRVKGISERSCHRIIEARTQAGGRFKSYADFENFMEGKRINKTVRERLQRIGSFVEIEGGLPVLHPDRLRDQIEFIPGLIVQMVKTDRKMEIDKFVSAKIIRLTKEFDGCENCNLAGRPHLKPRMGKSPKVMVITDCPTWIEEEAGELMAAKSGKYVREAMKHADLSMRNMYFTTLLKAKKDGKVMTNEQINGCYPFLEREIEYLKPPVIVALGATIARKLVPDLKGGYTDIANKVIYDKTLDATIIVGINPATIYHHSAHQEILNKTFELVAEVIS